MRARTGDPALAGPPVGHRGPPYFQLLGHQHPAVAPPTIPAAPETRVSHIHNSTGAPNYSACLSPTYLTAMLHRPIGQFLPGQNPMDSVFECGPFRSILSFHASGHAFRSFAVLSGHSRAAPQCALHLPLPQKHAEGKMCALLSALWPRRDPSHCRPDISLSHPFLLVIHTRRARAHVPCACSHHDV